MDDSQLALAEYRMLFPGAAGSGLVGAELTAWQAEWTRVKASGLSATLITGTSMEGGGATGIRNFDQRILLSALLTRRAELDTTFDDVAFARPAVKSRPSGFRLRFSP